MLKKIFSAQDWENVPSEIQQIHTPSIVPIYNKVEEYVYYSHMPLIIYDLGRKNYLFCGNDASTYWATSFTL